MTRILLIFVLLINFLYGQTVGRTDSLLFNTKNFKTDRLLFYDKDCFVWIKQEKIGKEKIIELSFGLFKTIGDTIYFTFPDSTRSANRYYCYCKYEGYDFTGFQLYNIPETWPPGSIDRVYKDLYKTKPPNLSQMNTLVKFKAIRQSNKIIFLDHKDEKYLNNEFFFNK